MYNYIWDDLTISGKLSFCSFCSGTCGDDDNDLYNCSHCNPPDLVLQKSTLETSRRYFGTSHLSKQIGRIRFSLYPEKKTHEAHYKPKYQLSFGYETKESKEFLVTFVPASVCPSVHVPVNIKHEDPIGKHLTNLICINIKIPSLLSVNI